MPSSTNTNAPDLLKSKAHFGGNYFVNLAFKAKAFDLQGLFLRHIGAWVFRASVASAMSHHVLHVGLVSAKTQIGRLVIGGVSIFMANLNAFNSWPKKFFSNNQMNSFFDWLVIPAKCNIATALAVSGVPQNSANKFARSVEFVGDNSVKASDGSKIGNFVKTNVTGNRFPDFLHDLPLIVKSSVVMMQRRFAQKQIFGSYPSLATPL
jgi:hypothetical protein